MKNECWTTPMLKDWKRPIRRSCSSANSWSTTGPSRSAMPHPDTCGSIWKSSKNLAKTCKTDFNVFSSELIENTFGLTDVERAKCSSMLVLESNKREQRKSNSTKKITVDDTFKAVTGQKTGLLPFLKSCFSSFWGNYLNFTENRLNFGGNLLKTIVK